MVSLVSSGMVKNCARWSEMLSVILPDLPCEKLGRLEKMLSIKPGTHYWYKRYKRYKTVVQTVQTPVGTTLGRYVLGMLQACIFNTHPLSIHYVLVKRLNLFPQHVVGMHS